MKWPKEAVYEDLTLSKDFIKELYHQCRNVVHALHFLVDWYVVWVKKTKNSSALKSNKVKSCHFVVASAKIRHLTFANNK